MDFCFKNVNDSLVAIRYIQENSLNAEVPNLILQPLIENALTHGLSHVQANGWIKIKAKVAEENTLGKMLILEVEDNGLDLKTMPAKPNHGIGLKNAQDRLQKHYAQSAKLISQKLEGRGFLVRIEIPYKPLDTPRAVSSIQAIQNQEKL